ncbi:MAG: hypothetical protein V1797_20385 [Pseudomonadota bacterium]
MDAIFTIPYSEYMVINELSKHINKSDGCTIYIPASRQEKGVDFLVHHLKTRQCARFQVKGSKSYEGTNYKGKNRTYKYNLWFNNFVNKYDKGLADYYALCGIYSSYDPHLSIDGKRGFWKPIILCIPDDKMGAILDNILTKKKQTKDKFFGIGFDDPTSVFGTRGFLEETNLSEYLLTNVIGSIKGKLADS